MMCEQGNYRPSNESEIDWIPTIALRPHHFLKPSVKRAVEGKGLGAKYRLAAAVAEIVRPFLLDSSGYYNDAWGKSRKDFKRILGSQEKIYDKLRNLTDEDIVHLDVKPDPICNTCAIGRHCTSINYQSTYSPGDTVTRESLYLSKIYDALKEGGFREGEDFIFQITSHVLIDFREQNLKAEDNLGESKIEFNSMLVKVRSLKEVIPFL